ncbi:hypothetical protein ABWI01_08655 [Oceanicaulis alexandrii]|uniref:hypothetical protein n=1 Tax=Oceanicaulis alexandrii TaxID=153233 RepID=UPI0035CF74A4
MLRAISIISLMLITGACSQPQARTTPEQITLPHWRACLETYDRDVHQMADAVDEGDPDAIVCTLALHEGRYVESHRRELLYRYYRATGREPEGLDASIRKLDRQDLAASLRTIHRFSPELDMFELDFRGCPVYDPVARDLLMRVEAPDDTHCLPRRWRWW